MKTRTELLMQALGWQGGTVHDICHYVGIDAHKFLYTDIPSNQKMMGDEWFMGTCISTNSMEYRHTTLVPKYQGKLNFWLGVCRSMELVNMGVCGDYK